VSGERPDRRGLDGEGLSIAIARSRFNAELTDRLARAARETLRGHGVSDDKVRLVECPGAFELPLVAKCLAESGDYDAVIAVGAVVRGETDHYDLVARAAAEGIARAALETGVPVIFGVLATSNREQAEARAGGVLGNRGEDAALAAIEMARLLADLGRQAR
jgi:6,7-dimethyl-8-ribityllumazine synthase